MWSSNYSDCSDDALLMVKKPQCIAEIKPALIIKFRPEKKLPNVETV